MAQINPFQGPINYAVDVQSPFEAALGGFKVGQAGAEMQAQAQAREQKQKFQTGLSDFFKKPDRTYEDLEQLLPFADKQQFDALTKVGEVMEKRKLDTEKRFSAQTLLALESDPTVAKTMLQERFEAEKDPNQKRALEAYIKTIDVNPKKAAELIELTGAATFGKDWYQGITDARTERRTAAKAPFELTEAEQKSKKAKSDAEIGEEEAKNIAVKIKNDLDQQAAQLGLTNAQKNQAFATTRKLGVETQKAALELEALKATGGADPAKNFEQEEKLRKEYQARTKIYGELGSTYANIKASAGAKSGAGDVALITGFMKMLDPTSVVRETEFATARDTAGLYTKLENSLKKAESGQFLQPGQRQEFVNLANEYYKSAQKKADDDKKALGVVVKNYRLNSENVFGPESASGGAGRGSVNPVVITLPNGQSATFSNQQQADAFKKAAGM